MGDYRQEFYKSYHIAVGAPANPSKADYELSARQFNGRWKAWLPEDKASVCVDLACGNGDFLYFLRSNGFENAYGVDLNQESLAAGRQMGLENLEYADLFTYLSGKEAVYDQVSAFNIFEHLKKEEILALLKLVHKALKPGGRLLAVTPNGLSPFAGATRYHDFSHETGFTPASWRQLARLNGFQEAIFEEMGPIPHSLKGKLRTTLWKVIKSGIIAYNYVELASPRDASKVYTSDMKIILVK
ncbi:MAG: Methyltransferase type 11 [Chloroflexi bacterium]|jgi:SAM-dependent methyltransferase|nr:Methyltransferase type 11 [Chloroflexota bacterium]